MFLRPVHLPGIILYARKPKTIKPLGLRVQPHIEAANLDLQQIAKTELVDIPPWKLFTPSICLDLAQNEKSVTDPATYRSDFLELKDKYPSHVSFYTDGSKDGDRVAAAAVCRQYSLSTRLPSHASIYTAELRAIILALDVMGKSNKKKFMLFSDSLSCLQAVQHAKLDHPMLIQILTKLSTLHDDHFDIILCWVPGHMGFSGNERADQLAKQALNSEIEPCPIPYTDLRQTICQYVRHLWQESWTTFTSNKLFSIQPELGLWQPNRDLPRRDQVVLTRCRIGHSHYTHSFLLKAEPLPECVFCFCPMTIQHLLLECGDLVLVRRQFYDVTSLRDLFDTVSQNRLLQFLKDADLYSRL